MHKEYPYCSNDAIGQQADKRRGDLHLLFVCLLEQTVKCVHTSTLNWCAATSPRTQEEGGAQSLGVGGASTLAADQADGTSLEVVTGLIPAPQGRFWALL